MTSEQKRLREKLERLMARRELLPEVERTAINAEIRATADQLARLCALACHAVEQPPGPVVGGFVPTPDEPGEPELVDLRRR
jgi:hypothetical protein